MNSKILAKTAENCDHSIDPRSPCSNEGNGTYAVGSWSSLAFFSAISSADSSGSTGKDGGGGGGINMDRRQLHRSSDPKNASSGR
jgi:hypothetical protein